MAGRWPRWWGDGPLPNMLLLRARGERGCLRAELRLGVSLTALSLALAGTVLLPQRAEAACSTSGSLIIYQCDSGGVNIQPNASGSSSLTVADMTIPSGWINYSVSPSTASGPLTMLLTVSNTSVTAPGNGAVNVSSQSFPATITVNLGSDVTLQNTGGSGGLWIRNQVGGDITVTTGATITSTGSPGISATSNAGAVSITNTGTVTSTDDRGIYADGSPTGGTTPVTVSVNNSGLVNAYLAGIRVIDYLGTATLQNSGTVTSTTLQGLVAWSQSGDASIDNSGSVLARNYIGVHAMTDAGNVTVTNSGYIEAQRDTSLGASTTNQGIAAEATGNVSITNTATGRVIAGSDTGITATTANGTITLSNAGRVTGTSGVSANATIGTVSVTNTGTITATSGAGVSLVSGNSAVSLTNSGIVSATGLGISLAGTTNRLDNTGTITTTGTTAVQTGNGNSTVTVSGRIAANSAADTAIAMGSGTNLLVLADTASLVGKVTNTSSSNTLELTGSATGTLAGTVGAAGTYQGFANLTKSGTGTWTLSGTGSSLSGTAAIDTGTLVVTGTLGVSTMTIGNTTQATLNVNAGGTLTSSHATIGTNAGGVGQVTVSGAGSTWTSTGNIYVGNGGNGTLSVEAGAIVSAVDGYVSTLTGSTSSLTVTGAASAMNLSGVFIAGYSSGTNATVALSSGGQISGMQGTLGDLAGSSGTMTISGSGSKWSAFVNSVTYSGYMNVGRLGSGTLTVTDGGNVTGYRLYIGNEVGSTGTVTLSGSGSQIQMTSNLYVGSEGTGTLTLSDGAQISAAAVKIGYLAGAVGTLNVGAAAGQAAAAAGTINATEIVLGDGDSRLVLNHTATNYGIAANITGTGQLIVLNGTSILTGTNTYTGATTISGGTLQIGSGGTSGSLAGNVAVASGGTLGFSRSDALTYSGVISGAGAVVKSGTGTLTLTGANSYTGGTTISAGTLVGSTSSLSGNIVNNAALTFDQASAGTYAGIVSGSGSLTKVGAGTLTLTGANTYTGGTTISAGTLVGSTSSLSGNIVNNAALTFDQASAGTYAGAISGSGSLTKVGAGTLTLTGANSYTGGTTISAGTLVGSTISLTGAILNNAALTFDQAVAGTFASVISGSGSLTKTGVGTLNLTGANTYSGGTTVAAGGIDVAGSLAGDVSVASGATLSGSGSIAGVVTVNGGTVVGSQSAPLSMGALSLSSTANVNVTLGAPSASQAFTVLGNLTLDGTLNVTTSTGFGTGVYRIFTYGGVLTDNGLNVSGVSGLTGNVQTAVAGQVNLLVSDPGQTILFWNGSTITATGTVVGGTGTWTAGAQTNWTDSSGMVPQAWNSSFAVFQGTAGTVTVDTGAGAVSTTGMQFVTSGYVVTGGDLTLSGTAQATIRVGDGTSGGASTVATIASALTGTGGINKTDLGTLILTGANTYTGGTTISAGTLVGSTTSLTGNILNNAALTFDQASAGTYAGAISGSGSLTKIGAGTLTLSGSNTYTGGTTITAGTLVGSTSSLSGNILNNAALTFDQAAAGTYAGAITGTGSVTTTGGQTLTLTGTNSYSGGTTISSGRLQIGDGGTSGTLTGDVVDNGYLVFNRSDAVTFAGVISGSGSLIKSGTGALTLTGVNTYGGITTVSAGGLVVAGSIAGNVTLASGATLSGSGTIAGNVRVNGGTLAGSQTSPFTMGTLTLASASNVNVTLGAPSASAAFTVLGDLTLDGTLNVTADSGFGSGVYRIFTYGGALTDNGLDVSSVSGLVGNVQTAVVGQVNLLVSDPGQTILFWNGSTITATGTVVGGTGTWTAAPQTNWTNSGGTVPQAWNSGFAVFQGAAGTVTVDTSAGAVSTTGMQFVTSGYVVTGGDLALSGTAQATIRVGDGTSAGLSTVATIASALTGTGGVNKSDLGTLILTAANTYTGGTTISAGTLQIGNGGTSGTIAGNITDNSALVFNRSDAVTYAGSISGTGSLTQAGTGTLTLTGANTYSGGTTVAAGTLVGNTTSLTGNIVDNAALVFNQTTTGTYSGVISGSGSLTKTGAGTLILIGDNTYTGGTLISQGILQIGNGGTTGAIQGDVVNNATLVFNRSGTYNFPGTITGSGAVIITGGSTVNFTGASGYNGAITVDDSSFVLASGSVSNSSYTVGSGGSISGTGTISGLTVGSGGTAAPGYSPGTLSVAGNVTFQAGSVYAVDVTPTGDHDLITATGTATILGGTVAVNATTGGYGPISTLTILQASGGVSGTFASVTSNLAFLTPLLSYDANDVYLTLRRNDISFASQALTANQRAAAGAADGLGWGNPVYYALANLAVGTAPAAFDALSGEAYASASTVMLQQSLYLRDAVGARLGQAFASSVSGTGPATAALAPGLTPTLWMQGFGAWGNAWSNGNAATVSSDIAGVFGGADVALGDNWRVGLVGGYSRTTLDVDARSSSGTIDNYDIGLYAGGRYGDLGLKAGLTYTWHDLSMTRSVAFSGYSGMNTSGYDTGTTQLFGEAGYTFRFNGVALEPFAGLAYVHLSSGSLTETGSSSALAVSTGGMDTVFSSLGLRVGAPITLVPGLTVSPSLSLAWLHAFGDVASNATMAFASGSQPFGVSGVPFARDSALIGAGLDYRLNANAVLSASYSGQFAAGLQDNAFKGALTVNF